MVGTIKVNYLKQYPTVLHNLETKFKFRETQFKLSLEYQNVERVEKVLVASTQVKNSRVQNSS